MESTQYWMNPKVPAGYVDVVLDTDAYNEIDDQFAISYLLAYEDRLNIKGICAAPFLNRRVGSAAEGMEKSYAEIGKLLSLAGKEERKCLVYRGSERFLDDEMTPVRSDAAALMADLANRYSPEQPLYIVALGAITNVASAMLLNPAMKENCVIVWLGGHDAHFPMGASEFNMKQDIAAARVVMGSGAPFVQLPCRGVVDRFLTSKYELEHWLKGKNALCDYLYENTVAEAESYAAGKPWTRVIWDVTAVAWLLNDDERFLRCRPALCPMPMYDKSYGPDPYDHEIGYVYYVDRDALFEDLFRKLGGMV